MPDAKPKSKTVASVKVKVSEKVEVPEKVKVSEKVKDTEKVKDSTEKAMAPSSAVEKSPQSSVLVSSQLLDASLICTSATRAQTKVLVEEKAKATRPVLNSTKETQKMWSSGPRFCGKLFKFAKYSMPWVKTKKAKQLDQKEQRSESPERPGTSTPTESPTLLFCKREL